MEIIGADIMANRAYLYVQSDNSTTGVSEYKYGAPITYKILISKNTRMVKSKIFKSPFRLALQGDYQEGVSRLFSFLDELKGKGYFSAEEMDKRISETKAFLKEHKGTYFHLEAAETYETFFPAIGNRRMLKSIRNIEKETADFYHNMDVMQQEYDSLYARMSEDERNSSGAERLQKIKDRMMWYIGIQEWAEHLYYEV